MFLMRSWLCSRRRFKKKNTDVSDRFPETVIKLISSVARVENYEINKVIQIVITTSKRNNVIISRKRLAEGDQGMDSLGGAIPPETWVMGTRQQARSQGRRFAVRGHSECKGPGAGLSLGSSRRSKPVCVAGMQ